MSERLTYANIMATGAVSLALGGGAYAATHLGKNSVGTKQLKANAVNGSKVKDGSLTGADINASSLGTVPSAGHADSADSFQGHPASDFLPPRSLPLSVGRVRPRARGQSSGAPVEADFWFVHTLSDGKVTRLEMFSIKAQALEAAGLQE